MSMQWGGEGGSSGRIANIRLASLASSISAEIHFLGTVRSMFCCPDCSAQPGGLQTETKCRAASGNFG